MATRANSRKRRAAGTNGHKACAKPADASPAGAPSAEERLRSIATLSHRDAVEDVENYLWFLRRIGEALPALVDLHDMRDELCFVSDPIKETLLEHLPKEIARLVQDIDDRLNLVLSADEVTSLEGKTNG